MHAVQHHDHSAVFGEESSDVSKNSDLDEREGIAGAQGKDSKKQGETSIAAKESKAVRWIRVVAIAVVSFSTLGVALAVFYYMSNTEKDNFSHRFKSDSHKILESIRSTFHRSLGSVDAFAINVVSSVKESSQSFPFVTLADYPVKASKLLTLSRGVIITPYYYLTHQQRPAWNEYTKNNTWWVNETLDVQEKAFNKTYFGSTTREWLRSDDLWHYDGPAKKNDFYYVGWQQFPIVPDGGVLYNWDYWRYLDAIGKRMLLTHQAAITSAFNLPDPNNPDEVAYVESNAEWYRDYLPPDRDPYEPYSDLLYVCTFANQRMPKVNLVV
jgi:hypothetical protein